tara:strand:+ start:56 stop:463 length:408 start_codon:yes stop_codon:yes gene_type:complete
MVEIDPLTGLPKELLALEEISKEQQLSNDLLTEQQRLEKLWDAYEQQEKELHAALDRIAELERILEGKNTYPEESNGISDPETKEKQTKIIENIESVTDSKLSNVEQMEKLIQLRNNGGITPDEFKQMKKEILGK